MKYLQSASRTLPDTGVFKKATIKLLYESENLHSYLTQMLNI